MMDRVEAETKFVPTVQLRRIMRGGKAPDIPVSRVPILWIAEIAKTTDSEVGPPAAALIDRVVRARNSEHLEADILAEVRRLTELSHAGKAYGAVDDETGRDGQCVPNGNQVDEIVKTSQTSVTQAISDRLAHGGHAVKEGPHRTVLPPNPVPVVAVPVDLPVEVVAVKSLGSRGEIVRGVTRSVGTGDRVQNLGGDGIDWYGSLVGKRLATCTVRIACRGVVDGRTRLTEVSGPNIGRGHCLEQTAVIALECPIPTKEEKQLVLPDRATQGAARVI